MFNERVHPMEWTKMNENKIIKQFAKQTKHDIESGTSIKWRFALNVQSKNITGNNIRLIENDAFFFALLYSGFYSPFISISISMYLFTFNFAPFSFDEMYAFRNTPKETDRQRECDKKNNKINKRKVKNDMVYIVVTLNIALLHYLR